MWILPTWKMVYCEVKQQHGIQVALVGLGLSTTTVPRLWNTSFLSHLINKTDPLTNKTDINLTRCCADCIKWCGTHSCWQLLLLACCFLWWPTQCFSNSPASKGCCSVWRKLRQTQRSRGNLGLLPSWHGVAAAGARVSALVGELPSR